MGAPLSARILALDRRAISPGREENGLPFLSLEPSVDAVRTSPGPAGSLLLQRLLRAALVVLGAAIAACSSSKPAPPPAPAADSRAAALWGDVKAVVSVKELMKYM